MKPAVDRSIDIRQLRYFVAVAEELSFRRAAERLHVTQPPLSRQIAALESALGVRLFERDTRSARLTAAGELALREFAPLLRHFEDSLARVSSARTAARLRLRVGVLWWADLSGFAPFESALTRATGIATVEPVVGQSAELMLQLRRCDIDATMVVLPQETDGLRLYPVARASHVAMIPAAHPLARKRALRLHDLVDMPPFLRFRRSDNPRLHDHFSRLYEAAGFRPAREALAQGTVATLSQIAAGRGCTVMPRVVAGRSHPGVAVRRLIDEIYVDVVLAVDERLDEALQVALGKAARRLASSVS